MYHFSLDVSQLKRESGFPYRLARVFCCRGLCLSESRSSLDCFEFCLRLESGMEICNDIINGEPLHVPYPHAVWKMPKMDISTYDSSGRDVLALIYPPESVDLFRKAGLIPETSCLPFIMNAEMSLLTEKILRLVNNLYSPGAADRLDWLGFSLMKEVLLAGGRRQTGQTMEQKITNAALYLKMHCSENPDFPALARQYNLNYTRFYREWSRYMGITPLQYIIKARLEAAADLLVLTKMPISKIIETVNFSGDYAFYRRFERKYGMTPAQYRKKAVPAQASGPLPSSNGE